MNSVAKLNAVFKDGARFGKWTQIGSWFLKERQGEEMKRGRLIWRIRQIPYCRVRCECGKEADKLCKNLPHLIQCKDCQTHLQRKYHEPIDKELAKRWKTVIGRCEVKSKKAYKDYGGRGIVLCHEWRTNFWAFRDWALANGYHKDLELDRIDNNGNYEPSNCRWTTCKVQANNSRKNVHITAFGETKTPSQWADDERCKVSGKTVYSRFFQKGWSAEEAILTPKMRSRWG